MNDRRQQLEQGARRINTAARSQMSNGNCAWYVGFVPPQKEFIAQKMLKQFGAYAYLPMHRKWRRANRTTREKKCYAYPALPGCLFFGLEIERERWYDLFNLGPVRGVLGLHGKPTALPGARLNAFLEENGDAFTVADEQRFMRTHHEFATGDRVNVVDGPFDGRVAEVTEIVNSSAKIWINLLGTQHLVDIGLDQLEKAS